MTDSHLIPAPEGWADYAAGRHLGDAQPRTAAAGSLVEWLVLLDHVDDPKTLAGLLPDERAEMWIDIEGDHIGKSDPGASRKVRLDWLQARAEAQGEAAFRAEDSWASVVAEGRLHLLIADLVLKEKGNGVYVIIEEHLNLANHQFAKVEGGDFLTACAEIIRGKNKAWRNDVPGATASLSYAMGVFRASGHHLKEAEAAYELAIANLDIGNGHAAAALLGIATEAYRSIPGKALSLARALQSAARARLIQLAARAGRAYEIEKTGDQSGQIDSDLAARAEEDAETAFRITASTPTFEAAPVSKMSEAHRPQQDTETQDGFRAAMAARDLAALELFRASQSPQTSAAHLQRAEAWFRAACTEAGFGAIFERDSSPTLRREKGLHDRSGFTVRRLAQLEYEILAQTAPADAAPLLVEMGKHFQRQSELNYAVECYLAAAEAFRRAEASSGGADEDETRPPERPSENGHASNAEYWRYRALRIAQNIGYTLPPTNALVSHPDGTLQDTFTGVIQELKADILNITDMPETAIHAGVRLSGRREESHLVVMNAAMAKTVHLPLLQTLSERGDIPYVVETLVRDNGVTAIAHEKMSATPLRAVLEAQDKDAPVLKIGSRLCRTVAGLMHAHSVKGKMGTPLFITPDEIDVIPGDRCVVTRYGPMFGLHQPSIGWAFLYAGLKRQDGAYKAGADAVALARILRLLLGVDSLKAENLARGSYWRHVLMLKKKELDILPPDALKLFDNLLKGKFKPLSASAGDNDASKAHGPEHPLPRVGYRELMQLAGYLDSAAQKKALKR